MECDLCRGTGRLNATGTDAGAGATCHDCHGEGSVVPEPGAFAMPFGIVVRQGDPVVLTINELDRVAALFDDGTGEPETTVEAAEQFLDCIGGRIVPDDEDCPYCDGTGAFAEGECGACKGLGWI